MMYITNLLTHRLAASVWIWLTLMLAMLSQVSANVVIQLNNANITRESPTVTFPTIGYFQAKPHAVQHTGMLLLISMDAGCQFRKFDPRVMEILRQRKIAQSFESLGIAVSWKHAIEHDCFTYAQVAEAAAQFQTTYEKDVAPPVGIIFLILPGVNDGGPLDTPYNSGNGRVVDGAPVIDISFLSMKDGEGLQQLTVQPNISSISFNAHYEPGPWNAELFGAGYIAFCWLLVSMTILLVLYTCIRIFVIWRVHNGAMRRGARFYIYIYGIINAGFYAATQVTFGETYVQGCLHRGSSLISVIGFLMLMLLWASILAQVYPGRVAILLKVQIYIAMAVILLNVIFWIVLDIEKHTTELSYRSAVFTVSAIVIPGIQIVLSLTFALFSVKFAQSWYRFHVARDKFMELFIFSLIGFISFLFFSLYNVLYQRTDTSNPTPKQIGFLSVTSQVLAFIRMAAILCIFGLKIPKRHTSKSDWDSQSSTSANDQGNGYSDDTKYSGVNSKHIHQLMNDKHPMQNVSVHNSHAFEKKINCSTLNDGTRYETNKQEQEPSSAKTALTSALFCVQWSKTKQDKPDNSDRLSNTKQQMMKPSQSLHDVSVAIAESVKHSNRNNNNGNDDSGSNNKLEEPIQLSKVLASELSHYTDDTMDMSNTSTIDAAAAAAAEGGEEPFYTQPNHTLQSIVELPHLEETSETMEVEETTLNGCEKPLRKNSSNNIRFSKFPMKTPVVGLVVNTYGTPIAATSDVTSPTSPDRATIRTVRQSRLSSVSSTTSRDLFQAHPNRYI
ncbi:hypothetical protein BDF22DRAFT_743872 [Syncephalis plumigaleata]|nr:hypothetical protein BDF22DRAFT_743872 [Syncephalis plumigaleata]